jgi:hypothetical protein
MPCQCLHVITGTPVRQCTVVVVLICLPCSSCRGLTSRGLQGSIPPRGWDLPTLGTLSLANNSIQGTLPTGWAFRQGLQQLYLWGNPISGSISPDWRLPGTLETLELSQTRLGGTFPERWSLPAHLQVLDLSGCALELFGVLHEASWHRSMDCLLYRKHGFVAMVKPCGL